MKYSRTITRAFRSFAELALVGLLVGCGCAKDSSSAPCADGDAACCDSVRDQASRIRVERAGTAGRSCNIDADCTANVPGPDCGVLCVGEPLSKSGFTSLDASLRTDDDYVSLCERYTESEYCSGFVASCAAFTLRCAANQCTLE